MTAHLLWHVPEGDEYKERAKLIGVYSTYRHAQEAIERLKDKPGFAGYPVGFETDPYEMDRDHWEEGFGIVED
jgi:homoserine kinase type II